MISIRKINGVYTIFADARVMPKSNRIENLFEENGELSTENFKTQTINRNAMVLVTISALSDILIKTDMGNKASNAISHLYIGIILIDQAIAQIQMPSVNTLAV